MHAHCTGRQQVIRTLTFSEAWPLVPGDLIWHRAPSPLEAPNWRGLCVSVGSQQVVDADGYEIQGLTITEVSVDRDIVIVDITVSRSWSDWRVMRVAP
jgi:hypothetical protein